MAATSTSGSSLLETVTSRAVGLGVLAGAIGALLFMMVHAVLITPIWVRALPQAIGVAVLGGGVIGFAYGRVREEIPGPSDYRGAVFGGLVASVLVPPLFASAALVAQSPLWVVVAILALSTAAVVVFHLALLGKGDTPWAGEDRRRFLLVFLPALLLNAYPALFLVTRVPAVDVEGVPNPWPQTLALGLIYIACGWILERLVSLDDAPPAPPARA